MSDRQDPSQEDAIANGGDAGNREAAAAKNAMPVKKGRLRRDMFAWLQALVFALLALILCFTFLARIISVQGSSMYPSLHDRDLLFLQCVGYQPKAGDVVVLNKPFGGITAPVVKRIIAVGGQTIRIDYTESVVYVDGIPLDEPYINERMFEPGYTSQSYVEVPEGSIFVMGDNRNASADSRDVNLGVVDERYILGRALFVLFPFSNMGLVPHA